MARPTIAFLLICAFLPGTVLSSANLSLTPRVVRQTYYDGTFSEVECGPASASGRRTCEFRIGKRRVEHTYNFDLGDFGYPPLPFVDTYNYWPNRGMPVVRFEVQCQAGDILQIAKADEDNTTCFIDLSPKENRLIASQVSISAIVSGEYFRAYRNLDNQP